QPQDVIPAPVVPSVGPCSAGRRGTLQMKPIWLEGNAVEMLINGEEFFPRVFERIRQAQKEVLLETFIILEDKVGKALQEALICAARNGAHVEVIVDGYRTVDRCEAYLAPRGDGGVRVHVFGPHPRLRGMRTNPLPRPHRKLVVLDRDKALVCAINFTA